MSPHAKFGLDWPSHSAGHRQHTDKQTDTHIAFYYVDMSFNIVPSTSEELKIYLYMRSPFLHVDTIIA